MRSFRANNFRSGPETAEIDREDCWSVLQGEDRRTLDYAVENLAETPLNSTKNWPTINYLKGFSTSPIKWEDLYRIFLPVAG
jgi:hypothetical protein